MSATMRIRRAHHVVRPRTPAQRALLERVVAAVPSALADALVGSDLEPTSVVCVRRVACRIRLRGGSGVDPQRTARRWAAEIVGELTRSLRATGRVGVAVADGGDVVVYRDRRAVVADVVYAAVGDSAQRRWAWVLAGVVPAEQPATLAEAAACALAGEPRSIAPTVAWLARRRPDVLRAWRFETWLALASAWATVAGPPSPTVPRAAAAPAAKGVAGERLADVRTIGAATSMAVEAIRSAAARTATPSEPHAVAALACLAAATGDAGADGDAAAIVALADALRRPLPLTPTASPPTAPAADPPLRPATDVAARWPADATAASMVDGVLDEAVGHVPGSIDADADDCVRQAATTAAGGLLFLLHLVVDLGLDSRIRSPEHPLQQVPFSEVMDLLGRELSGRDAADPAVLAFRGRLPGDVDTPSVAAVDPVAASAIADVAAEIDEALLARLTRACAGVDGRSAADVRAELILRTATIDGDPGWIEATFDASSADPVIRRAGLDLDPQYVPALGCVVRFRYV